MAFKDMSPEDITKMVGLATAALTGLGQLSFLLIRMVKQSKEMAQADKDELIAMINRAQAKLTTLPTAEELDAGG